MILVDGKQGMGMKQFALHAHKALNALFAHRAFSASETAGVSGG